MTRCSLFGKLAAKRDFIAVSAPREFLNTWEPWMQSCVSASRDTLTDDWLQAYLTAPIWRFWLGADICGSSIAGAFMSSLDGVGRYYPLTLFAYADQDGAIAPPDIDGHEQWFSMVEEFLLSTLDREVRFESVTTAIDGMAAPTQQLPRPSADYPLAQNGTLGAARGDRSFSDLFTLLRVANSADIYSAASFWWTVGGGECAPFGFCCHRLPEPSMFAAMLTGRLGSSTS